MLAFALVVTLGLLAAACLVCRGRSIAEVATVHGLAVFLGFCLFVRLPPVPVQAAVGLAALPLSLQPGRGVAGYRLACLAGFAAGWGFAGVRAWQTAREYERLRQAYPFESPADRLPARPPGVRPAFDPDSLQAVEGECEDREQLAGQFHRRTGLLRDLHEQHTRAFTDAAGFGSVRMVQVRPSADRLADPAPPQSPSDPSLGEMVRADAVGFADPAGWGYRRGDLVAGFRPHVLRRQPGPARGWAVTRVELVGLLLAPDPRVYVSATLPDMTAAADLPTRHPDDFESPALARLRAGEELVHDGPAGRLLGAVRAARQCLQCHGGERGDLLGAFSYRLRPR